VLPGPIRIGLSSGTNTVRLLPHPIANARTSTAKSIPISVSIDRHGATLHTTVEPADERDRDLGDDSLEHGAASEYQSS
jgi:hypothetical protein